MRMRTFPYIVSSGPSLHRVAASINSFVVWRAVAVSAGRTRGANATPLADARNIWKMETALRFQSIFTATRSPWPSFFSIWTAWLGSSTLPFEITISNHK